MARAKKAPTTAAGDPPALQIAHRLRAAMLDDPDFTPDDIPAETQGALEPGAIFQVVDPAGQVYRVRVNRIS